MASEDYWKERVVSWRGVGAGYAIAAFVIAGMLLAEAISFGMKQLEGQEGQPAIVVIRGDLSSGLELDGDTKTNADQIAIVDTLPDKEWFLFNCPLCE